MPKTIIPFYLSLDSGNRTTQFLNPRVVLDREKTYNIRCVSLTAFFTFPNIFATTTTAGNQNNTLTFTVGAVNHVINFAQGLYDITSLNDALSRALQNLTLSPTLIVLSADESTQRVVVQLNAANVSINFATSLCRDILGFNAITIGPGNSGNFYYSNNTANFNRVVDILVHLSICQGFYNNTGTQSSDSDVLCSVPINSSVGGQIQYNVPNTPICQLNTKRINDYTLYITDQDNRELILNDPFTICFEISED